MAKSKETDTTTLSNLKTETALDQIDTMAKLEQVVMVAVMEGNTNLEIDPNLFEYLTHKTNRPGQPKTESITYRDVRLFKKGDMERVLSLEEAHMDVWRKHNLTREAEAKNEFKAKQLAEKKR